MISFHSITMIIVFYISMAIVNVFGQAPGLLGGKMDDKLVDAGCLNIQKCKTKIQFGKLSGRMSFCPNGDCTTGKQVDIRMSKLIEVNTANISVNNSAENFNLYNFTWSTPITTLVNGINKTSTYYEGDIIIGKLSNNKKAYFKLTVDLYNGNITVIYGKQLLDIPSGSLKFTLDIKNWPFLSNTNKLLFGIDIRSRSNDNINNGVINGAVPKFNKTIGKTKSLVKVERFSLTGGSFVDTPTMAILDGLDTNITTKTNTIEDRIELNWLFPYFNKTLYYDPVIGDIETVSPLTIDATTATTNNGNKYYSIEMITFTIIAITSLVIGMF